MPGANLPVGCDTLPVATLPVGCATLSGANLHMATCPWGAAKRWSGFLILGRPFRGCPKICVLDQPGKTSQIILELDCLLLCNRTVDSLILKYPYNEMNVVLTHICAHIG